MSQSPGTLTAIADVIRQAQASLDALRAAQHRAVESYGAAMKLEKLVVERERQQRAAEQRAAEQRKLAEDLAAQAEQLPEIPAGDLPDYVAADPVVIEPEAPVAAPVAVEPAPAPEPEPVMPEPEPAPAKVPEPEPVPEPKPETEVPAAPVAVEPKAAPAPAPEPGPVPKPAPAKEPEPIAAPAAVAKPKPGDRVEMPAREPIKPAGEVRTLHAPQRPVQTGLKPGDRVAAPPRPEIRPAGEVRQLRPQGPRPGDRVEAPMRQPIRPAGEVRPLRPQGPGQGRPQGGPGGRPPMGPRPGGQGGPGGPRRSDAPSLPPVEAQRNFANRSTQGGQRRDNAPREKTKRDLFRAAVAQHGEAFDDTFRRGKRRGPRQTQASIVIESAVITTDQVAIKDLAEKIGRPAAAIVKQLFAMGHMTTINAEIDFDTALLVASEFGVELTQKRAQTAEETLFAEEGYEDDATSTYNRPPVVTVMGHVDHGKTSILDAVRRAKVAAGEAGGITQHIGAYQVNIRDRAITFLDTPGHEAFTAMRARGAQVTDIAVLVVAADDGIMPQTIEAINHAKAAKVPIVVAVNKIDRPNADPNRVMQMLTEHDLLPEEWGGDTVVCPVSALTGEGIDNLLEMLLLVADVRDLRANPNRHAKGTIIEAQLDRGRGPVATVLVQNGTLKVGDTIVAGTTYGRVRAMMDDQGQRLEEAPPSTPVEVLGFSDVPAAGDTMFAVEEQNLTRKVAEERAARERADKMAKQARATLDDLNRRIADGDIKDLNMIVKGDVQGSVEAVCQAMTKLSNDEVRVNIIHSGVGAIREQDVMLAMTGNCIIIGFNVRPEASAKAMADREKIDLRMYRVIYQAIEEVQSAMKGLLAPVFKEVSLGQAEVRSTFRVTGVGTIAGCYVTEGKITRNAELRLMRDLVVIHEGKVSSLKRFKDDVREVATGYECGIGIEGYNDIKEGDIIEAFLMEEQER